jgi:hypothetical protein
MRNIILMMVLLFGFSAHSQTASKTEYPILSKDSVTGQVLVIMTIEQAQKLDNATDLTKLFEEENIEIVGYDSACVRVVNDQNQIIATQTIQIKNLLSDNLIKDKEVTNLKAQIANYKKDLIDCGKQGADKDIIIKDQKHTINKQKAKMIIGGSLEGLAIIALIFFGFIHH